MVKTTDNGMIDGVATKRNLHFFWLLDASGSMEGKKIQTLNWAVKEVIPILEEIEKSERINILLRVIAIDTEARWHIGPKPVQVSDFFDHWKDLTHGGVTATDEAIKLLVQELDIEKIGKRNVPPVCILISDGYCTSKEGRYDNAIEQLDKCPWGKKAIRLSIGIPDADGIDYDKDELDKFISPYLKKESGIETLLAKNPKKLVNYIKVASVSASMSSSQSETDTSSSSLPAILDKDALEEIPPVDFDDIDPGDVF